MAAAHLMPGHFRLSLRWQKVFSNVESKFKYRFVYIIDCIHIKTPWAKKIYPLKLLSYDLHDLKVQITHVAALFSNRGRLI